MMVRVGRHLSIVGLHLAESGVSASGEDKNEIWHPCTSQINWGLGRPQGFLFVYLFCFALWGKLQGNQIGESKPLTRKEENKPIGGKEDAKMLTTCWVIYIQSLFFGFWWNVFRGFPLGIPGLGHKTKFLTWGYSAGPSQAGSLQAFDGPEPAGCWPCVATAGRNQDGRLGIAKGQHFSLWQIHCVCHVHLGLLLHQSLHGLIGG